MVFSSIVDCLNTACGNIETKGSDETDETEYEAVLECNYDKDLTPLYQALEEQMWIPALEILESDGRGAEEGLSPKQQARTWVSRYEDNGNLRWSQLPLHAAIIFKAPFRIIEAIVNLYPRGVKSKDDQDMLPLHLAFRYGSSDNTIYLLLSKYPEAKNVRGHKDRLPHECAAAGPNPNRTKIIMEYVEQKKKEMIKGGAVELKERYRSIERGHMVILKEREKDIGNLNAALDNEKMLVDDLKKEIRILELANNTLATSEAAAKAKLKKLNRKLASGEATAASTSKLNSEKEMNQEQQNSNNPEERGPSMPEESMRKTAEQQREQYAEPVKESVENKEESKQLKEAEEPAKYEELISKPATNEKTTRWKEELTSNPATSEKKTDSKVDAFKTQKKTIAERKKLEAGKKPSAKQVKPKKKPAEEKQKKSFGRLFSRKSKVAE